MRESVYVRPIAYIRCDYDEFDPYSYRGVTLEIKGAETPAVGDPQRFMSTSPYRDKGRALEEARVINAKIFVMSSWDNFVTDVMKEMMRLMAAGKD